MNILKDIVIPYNTGKAFILKKGQYIRVIGESTIDFVVFNLNNLRERFDQARTKVNQGKIFITAGDKLFSKFNNVMMSIVEDTYKEGTHDLQKGMCSSWVYKHGPNLGYFSEWTKKSGIKPEEVPDHGCWENLIEALKPWGIPPEDIPSPFNIFQTVNIDGRTGEMKKSEIKPKPGTYIDLLAEMDCLIGVSACPAYGRGSACRIIIYEK